MNLNATIALFTRSLREDNRLKQTYVARGAIVTFILLLLFQGQFASRYSGAPGLNFFWWVIYTNFFFISLTGLSYFASAVAEEKEDMTLGLLRMTNLGPLSILLGKSTSRLCGVFLLLVVQLPFTLLAITLGGVSITQVLAAYCTLGAYIFFLCNLALLFSSMSARVGLASTLTALSILAFFFLPLIGIGLLWWLNFQGLLPSTTALARSISWLLDTISKASPFNQLGRILTTGFSAPPIGFQVVSNLVLGVGCFLIAWASFDYFTRDQKESTPSRKLIFRRTSRLGALGAGRAWSRAILWKDFYFLSGGLSGVLLKVLLYGTITFVIGYNSRSYNQRQPYDDSFWESLGQGVFMTFLLISGVELMFASARIFRVEVQAKTLSGLAGLPLSMGSIARQKAFAALPGLIPGAGYTLAGLLTMMANSHRSAFDDKGFWMACFVGGTQLLLLLHVTAYLSLRLKRLAVPAALASVYFWNMFVVVFISFFLRNSGNSDSLIVFYHCGLLALTGLIHRAIASQLAKLAAAES